MRNDPLEAHNTADQNESSQPMSLLDRHNMIVGRLREGTLTVRDYRREFTQFLEQREALNKEIDVKVCDALSQRWGIKWPERAFLERGMLRGAIYLGLMFDYLLLRADSRFHASFGDDVIDFVGELFTLTVEETTAQNLAAYAEIIRRMPRRSGGHVEAESACSVGHSTEIQQRAAAAQPDRDQSRRPTRRRARPKR